MLTAGHPSGPSWSRPCVPSSRRTCWVCCVEDCSDISAFLGAVRAVTSLFALCRPQWTCRSLTVNNKLCKIQSYCRKQNQGGWHASWRGCRRLSDSIWLKVCPPIHTPTVPVCVCMCVCVCVWERACIIHELIDTSCTCTLLAVRAPCELQTASQGSNTSPDSTPNIYLHHLFDKTTPMYFNSSQVQADPQGCNTGMLQVHWQTDIWSIVPNTSSLFVHCDFSALLSEDRQ